MKNKTVIVVVNLAESILLFRLPLLIAMKQQGLEVVVCAPDYELRVIQELDKKNIQFKQIKMNRGGLNPFGDLFYFLKLYWFFKKEKPLIVLNYTIKPVIFSTLAGYVAKVPKIFSFVTGLGSVFIDGNWKLSMLRPLIKILLKRVFTISTGVFVLNEDILKFLIKEKMISSEKAVVINGEGVDINYYREASLPSGEMPVFLMISRIIKDKGVCEYLEAAKTIKLKYGNARFLLVGGFDVNPSALSREYINSYITGGIIEYFGKVEDVRGFIQESSVYVLPSYAEGMPRSTLEAMSMGRPVITTDVPGCRNTVINGYNGYLVSAKDVEQLAAAMEKFILNPEIIMEMGRNSRKMVEEKFSVEEINGIILIYTKRK